jgi:D-alanyl-D-alanine dipeptidase
MSKYLKWVVLWTILFTLTCTAVVLLGFWLPWHRAVSTMPAGGKMVIEAYEDRTLMLTWPESDRADRYYVEIFVPASSEEEEPQMIYQCYSETPFCYLPRIPDAMELTLRVNSVVDYDNLTGRQLRFGKAPLEVTTTFRIPAVILSEWTSDPDTQTVDIAFELNNGDLAHLSLTDDSDVCLMNQQTDSGGLELVFGDKGDLPVPGFGKHYDLTIFASRQEAGLMFRGYVSARIKLVRDDFLGRNLVVTCTDMGDNVCHLSWNETKGEYYEVQSWNAETGDWNAIYEVPGDGERNYTSPHLKAFSQYIYRVVAVGGQTMEDSPYAAVSDAATFNTRESAIFATVWPTKNLKAYSNAERTEEVTDVPAGEALCVLDEENGMFAVGINGQVCYIDSNYCMINLPEYIGDLCSYRITNSYSSLYMVHEFQIPRVTDVITRGYEYVRMADGSFLVPLLYPTAQKLVKAAQSALTQGYRLKIYDSFRPYVATRQIYDLTEDILDEPIPEKTFTGVGIHTLNLPAPEKGEEELTYRRVMTQGNWELSSFLAKNGSLHNLGIALDLTLEELNTGKELRMQTSIHDLSSYSVLSRNNSNAWTLASIMKDAGFGDLVSEWWHFQDNEARDTLTPQTVYYGITAECWMADDFGWKYRKRDGTYYQNVTVTIGDAEYTFDEWGYVK